MSDYQVKLQKEKKHSEPTHSSANKFNYYAIYGAEMGELVAAKSELATEFYHALFNSYLQ